MAAVKQIFFFFILTAHDVALKKLKHPRRTHKKPRYFNGGLIHLIENFSEVTKGGKKKT